MSRHFKITDDTQLEEVNINDEWWVLHDNGFGPNFIPNANQYSPLSRWQRTTDGKFFCFFMQRMPHKHDWVSRTAGLMFFAGQNLRYEWQESDRDTYTNTLKFGTVKAEYGDGDLLGAYDSARLMVPTDERDRFLQLFAHEPSTIQDLVLRLFLLTADGKHWRAPKRQSEENV